MGRLISRELNAELILSNTIIKYTQERFTDLRSMLVVYCEESQIGADTEPFVAKRLFADAVHREKFHFHLLGR